MTRPAMTRDTQAEGTGPQGQGLTRQLAEQALSFADADVPADVAEIVRHCLLDWFSVALAAWDSPVVQTVGAWTAREPGAAQASLLDGPRVSMSQAALVNGTASHVLDFDDAHLPSRVHPSVPLWAAVLALAEARNLSGRQAMAAFVAGVQVQSRLAAVMGNSHYGLGWHNTATLGTFGATAAAARLEGLDGDRLCAAFGLAATLAGGLRSVFGSGAKPLHAGRAAANGLMAAGLVREGLESVADILEKPGGYVQVYAQDADPAALARPPVPWEPRRIVFKYHTSCYGTQAPIEAALALREQASPAPDSRVEVFIEPQYMSVCNIAEPVTASQAKFSVAHMVALALAGRSTTSDAELAGEGLCDPQVLAWRARIRVQPDPALPRAHARVVVHGPGGPREQSCDASQPQADLPLQRRRLLDKSSVLLRARYRPAAIEQAQQRLLEFDRQAALGDWWRQLLGDLAQGRR